MREIDITRQDVIMNLHQLAFSLTSDNSEDRMGLSCAIAASMLEGKEPVPVSGPSKLAGVLCGKCPACGVNTNSEVAPHYCGVCGTAIKWE